MYLGAGTSGRLGVLDAAECPPTFSTPPGLVVGIIAGGAGRSDLRRRGRGGPCGARRAGLAGHSLKRPRRARGDCHERAHALCDRRPGLRAAARRFTIGLSCNRDSQLEEVSELMITPVVGPEVLSGSTRLKAGTATKMVLNMLTTASMVRLGKTYGNLLVDMRATNTKLLARARRIVATVADVSEAEAENAVAAVWWRSQDGDHRRSAARFRRRASASSRLSTVSRPRTGLSGWHLGARRDASVQRAATTSCRL